MATYSFRLEMAWDREEPNEAWALYRRLEAIAEKSPMQTNSFTLLRNGKDFPRSLEEYENREKAERKRRWTVAEQRVAAARDELSDAIRAAEELRG